MPITGLGSTFALGVESTYATSVAATRRYPFISESIDRTFNRIEPNNLRGATRLISSSDWRPGLVTVDGDIQTQLYDRGISLLLRAMLGAGATTGAGPYTHTFSLGTLPSHTLYIAYGGASSVPMKTVVGAVCSAWEISLEAGSEASLSTSWVARSITTTDTGTPAGTYPTGQVMYVFTDGAVNYGGSSPGCVRSITISGDNAQDASRVCIGQTTRAQPIENAMRSITGTMTVEFETWAGALAAAVSGAEAALTLVLTAGSNTLTFGANVRIDGGTPPVAGADVVTVDIPFKATAGGAYTSGPTIIAVNGDTTIS